MKTVEQNSTDWSIRFFAYDVDGAAVTGLTHASGGMAASVVVRSKGRIVSTTSLTLSARSQVGVHQDSAMTEVGSGEYVIDLADSYFTTVDRTISLTVSATAITGNVLVEMLDVIEPIAEQVNAELLDVLTTDTFAELAAVPAATSSLKDKLTYLFMMARNKVTQTATTRLLKADDGTTTVATETVSDDGTTFTKGEAS